MCTQALRRSRTCLEAVGQWFETVLWSLAKLKIKYRLQSPGRDTLLIRLSPVTVTAMRPVQASNVLPTTNFYVPKYALSCQSENQFPLRNCIVHLHLTFKLALMKIVKNTIFKTLQVLYFATRLSFNTKQIVTSTIRTGVMEQIISPIPQINRLTLASQFTPHKSLDPLSIYTLFYTLYIILYYSLYLCLFLFMCSTVTRFSLGVHIHIYIVC
jgi:hypothetical protein